MIPVTLDWFEVLQAGQVGLQRHVEALRQGLPNRYGAETAKSGLGLHIEGACGELALAKAMNWYWSGTVNTFRTGGDVGEVQVRTRSSHDYDLIVREADSDTATFVLVTGTMPSYRVHGHVKGAAAKNPDWLAHHGNRPNAYFVPQWRLTPIIKPTG